MRITKVITKTGDRGQTGLVGGERVSKASPRVEAYGDVDELNSLLGLVRASIRERPDLGRKETLDEVLKTLQEQLFVVGADLATPLKKEGLRVTPSMTIYLEEKAQELSRSLDPLKEFVLPTGDVVTALLHVARTVARRAERHAVRWQETEPANGALVPYLNRLSDFLFILGRFHVKVNQIQEDIINFQDISKRFQDR